MAAASPRPEALGEKYPSKSERRAAKRARQQAEQAQEPTPAELNTSRMSAAEHEAAKRSAALRAQHLTNGPLPIEVLTSNDYDTERIHDGQMVDRDMPTQVGMALDPQFVGWLATHRYRGRRVVRPAKNPSVWPKLWERANAGDRVAQVAIGRLHNLTVIEIAQQLGVTTRTVDRDIERIPALMQELMAHG